MTSDQNSAAGRQIDGRDKGSAGASPHQLQAVPSRPVALRKELGRLVRVELVTLPAAQEGDPPAGRHVVFFFDNRINPVLARTYQLKRRHD